MEAIKKKMQMLKVDKEDALDRAEAAENSKKAAEEQAGKAEEELHALLKKQKATEAELNSAKERLSKVQIKFKLLFLKSVLNFIHFDIHIDRLFLKIIFLSETSLPTFWFRNFIFQLKFLTRNSIEIFVKNNRAFNLARKNGS